MKVWKSETRLSGKYLCLLSQNDKLTKVFEASIEATEFYLLITVHHGFVIEGAILKTFEEVKFTGGFLHWVRLERCNSSSIWQWLWEIQKSRNPLIHRSYSIGIIPSVTLFCFLVLPSIRLCTVQFKSLLLLSYEGCYFVLNVASGQQAFMQRSCLQPL